ncbi:LysR substrate-binding domain-containing protein [Spongiibacter taiwanensis]|uniref:LysR family transcriptional regulator n=1 Tax=Spongiibacter taiwanensis TaxID=1748242 RepID=UPI002034C6F5|nr:LysR substrate-binding domain-containing protein [Spongiibacter taiwanensis]USA43715.1 LysR substrate-binding domain-containing protein [Spongiibacter taiwanensis]
MQPSYLNRLTLRQLDVFLAVCQHRSYSKAADHLALTQPAVSSQMRSLEELVQQPLFDYIGRQLYLTAPGELLERAAREIKQRLVHLEIELTELHGKLSGTLSIAIESSAEYLLPRYILPFCHQHKEAEIVLHVENHQRLMERLQENLDDLAIMTQVPGDRSLNYTPFAEHQLLAVARPTHPLAHSTQLSLLDLLDHRLLCREPGSGTRQIFESFCRENSLILQRTRQLGSHQTILATLLSQAGDADEYAILPRPLVEESLRRQQLIQLAVSSFPIRRSWCSAYPRGKHLNPLANAFLNTLHTPDALLNQRP